MRGTVYCITGDNLGWHCIGGFSENFSTVDYFCRYCLIQKDAFKEDPCAVGPSRTVQNYETNCREITEGVNSVSGIKFDSKCNALSYFNYNINISYLPMQPIKIKRSPRFLQLHGGGVGVGGFLSQQTFLFHFQNKTRIFFKCVENKLFVQHLLSKL